jgi:hypothetical protein
VRARDMKKTTIEIYHDDLETIRTLRDQYLLSNADFIRVWILAVKQHKQREMYSTLVMPSEFEKVKPLSGVKISKFHRENSFV